MNDTEATPSPSTDKPVLSATELADERRRGRAAGFVTALAAVLIMAGIVWASTVDRNDTGGKPVIAPQSITEKGDQAKLTRKARDKAKDDQDKVEGLASVDRHGATFLGSAVLEGFAFMLLLLSALHLHRATRARNPTEPTVMRFVAVYGPLAFGAGVILRAVALKHASADFVDQQFDSLAAAADEADSFETGALFVIAQGLALSGALTFALWLIKGVWDASKVGLLTKPFAVLGMGLPLIALIASPIAAPIALLWFIALAVLLIGLWPGGVPPAWGEGRAIPWPSRADSLPVKRSAPLGGERNGEVEVSGSALGSDENKDEGTVTGVKLRKRKRRE